MACVFISEKEILFFDSAPSFVVRRDIERMFANLGFTNVFFLPCPKQRRDSNECGLFVILNLVAFRGKAKKWFLLKEANLHPLRTSLGFEEFLENIEETQTTKNKKESDHHQLKNTAQKTKKQKDIEETKILCGGGQKELFCWNKYSANGAARENLCWCYCAVVFCSFVGRVVGKPFSFSVHLNNSKFV